MATNNTQNNMSTSLNNIKINKDDNNKEELNDKNIKELFSNIKNNTNEGNHNMMRPNPNMMRPNPNMMRQNPNIMQQNPNMMRPPPNMMQQNPNMMPQNPNMMPQNPNIVPQNPNMMPQNPNIVPQNPNIMPQNPNLMPQKENINNKNDLLNNLDKTFEKEMDNLIGNSSLNDINTSNNSFYNNKSYMKILAIMIIIYVLTNVKLLYLIEKFIPEQIYIKIIDIEKYIYSFIFGIIVYFLYKSNYI